MYYICIYHIKNVSKWPRIFISSGYINTNGLNYEYPVHVYKIYGPDSRLLWS